MKRVRTILLAVCLGLFFSTPGCNWNVASRPVQLHPEKCGITTLRFTDATRDRPVITEVWYPVQEDSPAQAVKGMWVRCAEARDAPVGAADKKYPLIIMSHGNGGDRLNNAWIAEIMAANGYIVAAMDHHGNTWNNQIAEGFIKIWERPKDVSFVIDQLLQASPFSEQIDHSKIGFIGYSLGGQTGLWLAGGLIQKFEKPVFDAIPPDQIPPIVTPETLSSMDYSPAAKSYKDPRVSAFFLMAPALGPMFDPASLQSIQAPIYIVASEGDSVVPAEPSGKIFRQHLKKAFFTLIPGAGSHYVFLNEATRGGKMMLDKNISQDEPSVDRKKIHEDVGLAAVQFFDSHLKN